MNAQIMRYENELERTMPELSPGQRMRMAIQLWNQDNYLSRREGNPIDEATAEQIRGSMPGGGPPSSGQLEIPSWPGVGQPTQGQPPPGAAPGGLSPQGESPAMTVLTSAAKAGLVKPEEVNLLMADLESGDETRRLQAMDVITRFADALEQMSQGKLRGAFNE